MCGIVGYTGNKNSVPIMIDGLKKLEYRGYDSAGVTIIQNGKININRVKGKIRVLEENIDFASFKSNIGIGHTRWATHGKPSEENAHPHTDCTENIVIVHNGIIENYVALKADLLKKGHIFKSETDTEVIVHLIEDENKRLKNIESAFFSALKKLEGSFALSMISTYQPDTIYVARLGSPLIIGLAENENFVASDIPAILAYTKNVIILDEYQAAVIKPDNVKLCDFQQNEIEKNIRFIPWDPIMAEKNGYKHFMLKEIFEQPRVFADTIQGRALQESGEIEFMDKRIEKIDFSDINKINIVACGTSYHAGLTGKFYLEKFTRKPVEVDIASEYRYRDLIVDKHTLGIFISQSGETADTLAALRRTKELGGKSLAICNVIDSTLARETDGVVYTHAGPEIGVASTKAFTSQVIVLFMAALYIGSKIQVLSNSETKEHILELYKIPSYAEETLNRVNDSVERITKKYFKKSDFLYLGRGVNYPIALEGALKLKEISYIHAEGYPAGEMKHGPIALIDENIPVVNIATNSSVYEKMLSNIEEAKARDGLVISIANYDDYKLQKLSDDIIEVPYVTELLSPIINVLPLQLLAYHIAVRLGNDVDQPRNLAKSVTVE